MGKFLNWFLADLKGETQRPVGPQGSKALTISPGLASTITNYGWAWNSYSALYRSQPAVRTVVDFLARNIAELRPKVYERNGNDRPEISDHPLQLLLRSPNPETTDFAHLRNTVADIAIFDRAYWRRYYFRGELKGILRIPPPSIWPEVDKETGHIVYRLANGERLTRKDLVVFSGYTPDGSDGGVSPLETLRRLLEEESASTLHRAAYWKNAARQSGWIERPLDAPEWSEEARKRFRADMESTMAGASNAGRIGVLEEGMSWNGTAFSPRESEVIESRKLTYEEVCRVYGIPFALIGAMSDSKSNVESFHRQLYQDVLAPWLRFLESEIELQLLPVFETNETRRRRIYVEFNLAAKLAGSFEEQGRTLVTAVGVPYMSINEARARLNLPSIDDEAFDEPVQPLNVMYGGQPAVTVPTEDPGTPQTLTAVASVEPDTKAKAEDAKRYEDSLCKYFERHEQAVLSKAGQNGNTRPMFADSKLWDRDLRLFLENWVPHLEGEFASMAKAINDVTYDELREELEADGDPRCVFTRAKRERAAELARGWAGYPLAPKHLPGEHDQDTHGGNGGGLGDVPDLDDFPSLDDPKVGKVVDRKVAMARSSEPGITAAVQRVSEETGVPLKGLEHRLKQDRLRMREKVIEYMVFKGKSLPAAADDLKDLVRYTFTPSSENYEVDTERLRQKMAAQGFKEIKFVKVGWYDDPENPSAVYKGVIAAFEAPNGQKVEVQVLTDQILQVKSEQSHGIYEELRAPGTSPERKAELEGQLIEIWRHYPVP